MNGVPELLILKLLRDQEMCSYEIVQAVRYPSDGTFAFGEGVAYPELHALEREGSLRSHRKTANGRSRIYYSSTPWVRGDSMS
ncbi:MAG: PadR family transcriptional regulator [Opitutaceae bacterium]